MRNPRPIQNAFESGLLGRPAWVIIVSVLLVLTGCAGRGERLADSDEIPPEIARIPDAVPKVEPLSRSGNASTYVVFGKRYYTKKSSRGHVERGLASWYGKPFHGRKTSSGEVYDMHAMTAAHKTLPLPTYARVTNVENGRSIVVKINDRGPFHGPRIVDLSYTAAVKLGVVKRGTAKVEVRAIDPRRSGSQTNAFLARQETPTKPRRTAPLNTPAPPALEQPPAIPQTLAQAPRPPARQGQTLYLQVGAFGDQKNAQRLRALLAKQLADDPVLILQPPQFGARLYRVRIGPLSDAREAQRISRRVADLGVGMPEQVWN